MKSPVLYTLLCLLLCFLSGAALQAQTLPKFRHLTTADGLPSNGINAIFEDKAGFLWIGTDAGLARYDGRNVEAFRYNSNSENSIAGNGVFQITQDGRGNIWAMTAKHLYSIKSGFCILLVINP
jgi:ligand-binding sensor domain-containing protein